MQGDSLKSLLFVPGNKQSMLDKALAFSPSAFVPDMEDSVPECEKAAARELVGRSLEKFAGTGALVIPRVNDLGTGLLEEDLAAVVGPHIHGVSVGKVSSAADVARLCEALDRRELAAGVAPGATRLVPWVETAAGVAHCREICAASGRIVAVAFGAEDYTLDMEIERGEDESELLVARNILTIAARAAGVAALDTPFFSFRDSEALRRNAEAAKRLGFRGKFAIHPAQIETIDSVFAPSAAELEYARRVVAAFREAESQGRGSTSLEGKVVDVPVYRRALRLLARAGERQAL